MSEESFKPDARVSEIAQAYAQDAVDIAARNFGITLDWSEASIQLVEHMVGRLHEEMPAEELTEETVWIIAKAFGCYIGEVLRRHHGGEWGMVTLGGESFPGLRCGFGPLCWPWEKVYKRWVNGPEDNLWSYYTFMTQDWPQRQQ